MRFNMLGLVRIDVWIATALLLLGGQDGAKTEKIAPEEQLRALIEKTNELKSFVAEYQLVRPNGEEVELRVTYAARDRMCMRMSSESSSVVWVFREGRMTALGHDAKEGEGFMQLELLPVPADLVTSVLEGAREQFPKARILDPTASLAATITIDVSSELDEPRISVMVSGSTNSSTPLEWLTYLKNQGRLVTEDAEQLEFACEDDSRFVLQKSTGFLLSARVPSEGSESSIRLKSLELDVAVDDDEFQVPEPSADANIGGPEQQAAQSEAFWLEVDALKGAVGSGVGRLIDQQELDWDDEAKVRFRRALGPLHIGVLKIMIGEWIEQTQPMIDAYAVWFQNMRMRAGDDEEKLAELDGDAEGRERELRERIEPMRKCFREPRHSMKSDLWSEFVELDRAEFDAVFAEHVEAPILGRFAEKLQLAREGKLVDPDEK